MTQQLEQTMRPVDRNVDPIVVELIRHGLIAVAEEMKLNLRRTAYNPIIYEVLDFSCGVLDARAAMIAQADGLPIFLGNLGTAARCVMDDIGVDALRPGDIYLFNDPYRQGNHLNDVTTVLPVFDSGDGLAGFVSTRAHWLELGGKDPGGSIDATDVVQEGLWFGSVCISRNGEIDEGIWRIIQHNVRTPDAMLGDLRAQLAASATGAARLRALIDRYGRAVYEAAIGEMHRQGEQRARAAISAIPDGTYTADSLLDDDCIGHGPLPVRVAAIVDGDSLTLDLTGSAPQNPGPVNCGLSATYSAARLALKMFTNPDVPACEGDFAPLELVVPDDSMFNARYPAPTFMYGTHLILLADVIVRALGDALEGRAIGGHYGNLSGFMVVGESEPGGLFIHQEPEVGGWGASAQTDGENALIFMCDGDVRVLSTEIIEGRFPLTVQQFALRPDSGGAGRHRGGLGVIREYRLESDSGFLTAIMDRSVAPPEGAADGWPAAHCQVIVTHGDTGKSERHQKPAHLQVTHGTVLRVETGGGGGWGDPRARPVEAVLQDVKQGYITPKAARRDYGVDVSTGARRE